MLEGSAACSCHQRACVCQLTPDALAIHTAVGGTLTPPTAATALMAGGRRQGPRRPARPTALLTLKSWRPEKRQDALRPFSGPGQSNGGQALESEWGPRRATEGSGPTGGVARTPRSPEPTGAPCSSGRT